MPDHETEGLEVGARVLERQADDVRNYHGWSLRRTTGVTPSI